MPRRVRRRGRPRKASPTARPGPDRGCRPTSDEVGPHRLIMGIAAARSPRAVSRTSWVSAVARGGRRAEHCPQGRRAEPGTLPTVVIPRSPYCRRDARHEHAAPSGGGRRLFAHGGSSTVIQPCIGRLVGILGLLARSDTALLAEVLAPRHEVLDPSTQERPATDRRRDPGPWSDASRTRTPGGGTGGSRASCNGWATTSAWARSGASSPSRDSGRHREPWTPAGERSCARRPTDC